MILAVLPVSCIHSNTTTRNAHAITSFVHVVRICMCTCMHVHTCDHNGGRCQNGEETRQHTPEPSQTPIARLAEEKQQAQQDWAAGEVEDDQS